MLDLPSDRRVFGKGDTSRRSRLRLKIINEPQHAEDLELIELVLLTVVPRRDVCRVAKVLLSYYGSFASVISASPSDLVKNLGMTDACVASLKTVSIAAKRLVRAEFLHGKTLTDWEQLSTYLLVELSHEKAEHILLVYLNKRRSILFSEVHARGTVRNVAFDLRKLVGRALELNASFLVIAHNHPSGDIEPSEEDIQATYDILDALAPLKVELLDHIIIGNGACLSLRKDRNLF